MFLSFLRKPTMPEEAIVKKKKKNVLHFEQAALF